MTLREKWLLAVSGSDPELELVTSSLRQNCSWTFVSTLISLPCINSQHQFINSQLEALIRTQDKLESMKGRCVGSTLTPAAAQAPAERPGGARSRGFEHPRHHLPNHC